jgi:hypothetical protein
MYQNQIASETLLVETAVQKQVQNKIQQATFFISGSCSDTFCKIDYGSKNALSHYGWSLQRRKNADKTLRILNRLGYDAKRIAPNKKVIIRFIW